PGSGVSPRRAWTRITTSLPAAAVTRLARGTASRAADTGSSSGAGPRGAAPPRGVDVRAVQPPTLLITSASAPRSRKSAQSRSVGRKARQFRRIRPALISRGEIAGLIRRNCLAFRPTERDWADLRDLGADADVMSSVGGCTARTSTPRGGAAPRGPAPELLPVSAALEAVPLASRVTAAAGSDVVIRVQARRGETPEPG